MTKSLAHIGATAAILALTLAASLVLGPTAVQANQADVASSYVDAQGNLVLQTPQNGAKIIRVGTADRSMAPTVYYGTPTMSTAPRHPSILMVVPAANTRCDSAIVVHGRSFMYGLDRGETPVLGHTAC